MEEVDILTLLDREILSMGKNPSTLPAAPFPDWAQQLEALKKKQCLLALDHIAMEEPVHTEEWMKQEMEQIAAEHMAPSQGIPELSSHSERMAHREAQTQALLGKLDDLAKEMIAFQGHLKESWTHGSSPSHLHPATSTSSKLFDFAAMEQKENQSSSSDTNPSLAFAPPRAEPSLNNQHDPILDLLVGTHQKNSKKRSSLGVSANILPAPSVGTRVAASMTSFATTDSSTATSANSSGGLPPIRTTTLPATMHPPNSAYFSAADAPHEQRDGFFPSATMHASTRRPTTPDRDTSPRRASAAAGSPTKLRPDSPFVATESVYHSSAGSSAASSLHQNRVMGASLSVEPNRRRSAAPTKRNSSAKPLEDIQGSMEGGLQDTNDVASKQP